MARPFDRAIAALQTPSLTKSSRLLDGGIDVAVLQHLLGVRAHAEIGHFVGDVGPAMRHACRDDRNVTDSNLARDIIAYDLAAAGGTIEESW